jgi:hypothetical protein
MLLAAQGFFEWVQEFYALNIDRWVATGWFLLGFLTVTATIAMFLKILKSNKEIHP